MQIPPILCRRPLSSILLLAATLCVSAPHHVDAIVPNEMAIRVNAIVQSDPPAITLIWPVIDSRTSSFKIQRRTNGVGSWADLATIQQPVTQYVDSQVFAGVHYEYQITATLTEGSTNYMTSGLIYSGINVPLVEDRGKMVLVVDRLTAAQLPLELARLEDDLIGDGWTVVRRDIGTSDPVEVKAVIKAVYNADPTNVKAVFLFGNIPYAWSGRFAPDGHEVRPHATDGYYGDMNGIWTDSVSLPGNPAGDGVFDHNNFGNELAVELAVGRVDMRNLPLFAPLTEYDLLRRYLNKDHAYRQKHFTPQQKGFVSDGWGMMQYNEAPAQGG